MAPETGKRMEVIRLKKLLSLALAAALALSLTACGGGSGGDDKSSPRPRGPGSCRRKTRMINCKSTISSTQAPAARATWRAAYLGKYLGR